MHCLIVACLFGFTIGYAEPEQYVLFTRNGMRVDPTTMASTSETKHSFTLNSTFDTIDLDGAANTTLLHTTLLDFERWAAVNTTAAHAKGFLSAGDMDCAMSSPNTLLSRHPVIPAPSIIRSNATALAARNASEFFDLRAVSIKPVGVIAPGASVVVNAWELVDGKAENVYQLAVGFLSPGHAAPLYLEPDDLFPGWGLRVNAIEISAFDYTGKRQIEVCIDNLIMDFY